MKQAYRRAYSPPLPASPPEQSPVQCRCCAALRAEQGARRFGHMATRHCASFGPAFRRCDPLCSTGRLQPGGGASPEMGPGRGSRLHTLAAAGALRQGREG
jgi:hypothetical protein